MARRRRSDHIETLRSIALFSGLSNRQLNEIAKAAFEQEFAAGDQIVKQLDAGQMMVTILEGSAKVTRDGRKIASLGPGDVVGEMSLIDGLPRSASVTAESDIEALVLYRTAFRKLLDEIPALARGLLLTQTQRIRELDKRAGTLG